MKLIPLTSDPNQNFAVTIPVDGKNLSLVINLSFNMQGQYWWMKISKPNGDILIDALPLVYSEYPAADIFAQFRYLNLGSACIVKTSDVISDIPDNTNLGTDFVLVWGDTIE